jgi:putative pyruvate formate lyase activating enzyme
VDASHKIGAESRDRLMTAYLGTISLPTRERDGRLSHFTLRTLGNKFVYFRLGCIVDIGKTRYEKHGAGCPVILMVGQRAYLRQTSPAGGHYTHCQLCEHRCGANRSAGERGPCHAGVTPRLFRNRIEYSEERELIPSHLFYLSGCDLRCVFCIAGLNAFDPRRGVELTRPLFNELVASGIRQGARTLQWVGGEPAIHIPALLELMAGCPDLPPVVFKSDFHFTPEALDLLDGRIDWYVADFKFGNAACAERLGGGADYLPVVQRNLKLSHRQSRLIVRHLLLPGHLDCCFKPIARWLRDNLPDVPLSLRTGYLPSWRSARLVELATPLRRHEAAAALATAHAAGLRMIQ